LKVGEIGKFSFIPKLKAVGFKLLLVRKDKIETNA